MQYRRNFFAAAWVFAVGTPLGLSIGAPGAPVPGNASGASQGTASEPIKIGLVTAMNGDLRPWGQDCRDGVRLAVDEFNKRGGLHGRKVRLLVEDSNSRPEQGKYAAEKLISEGCITVLGEVASGISMAMREATTEKAIPQIIVAATRDNLTAGSRYLFRVCYTDRMQGPAMAKFAFKQLHRRRIAIMTDAKQPFSVDLSQSFRTYFKKLGGRVVDEEEFSSGQTAFATILGKLNAHKPDGVFCSGYFTEAGPIVRQAREMGITKAVPFLGGDGWDSREILSSGGDAIVGSYFCNHYVNDDPSPRVKRFLAAWSRAYSGSLPGTTCGALGYDAAGLALDALKRAKVPTAKGMRNSIEATVGFQGVTGRISLKGRRGNPQKRMVVVKLTNDERSPEAYALAYEYSDLFPNHSRRKVRKR